MFPEHVPESYQQDIDARMRAQAPPPAEWLSAREVEKVVDEWTYGAVSREHYMSPTHSCVRQVA